MIVWPEKKMVQAIKANNRVRKLANPFQNYKSCKPTHKPMLSSTFNFDQPNPKPTTQQVDNWQFGLLLLWQRTLKN